jgi:hypothetical protein
MTTIKATIVLDKSKDLDHGQKGTLEEEYIAQLSPIEKKAYKIAIEHLGTSFNLKKSNGFCDWLKDNNKR